jgi:GT2 family glycosyltransferase
MAATIIKSVSIVVPVYGDWDSLSRCVTSLKKHVNADLHRVLLVNDCGPEVDMIERRIKTAIKGSKQFRYYRNQENLGFVKNCNRAVLELDRTNNDILLLNSDAEVTAGFLEEMQQVLYAKKKICAVSPRSNNATIATIPLYAQHQQGLDREAAYEVFGVFSRDLPKYNIAPTAHGFCMLIRRSAIQELGLFDEVFGRGYGEEVDFCQRASGAGWTSAIANHAFVFHLGARSFSPSTKQELIRRSTRIIAQRYPRFGDQVQGYIQSVLSQEKRVGIVPPRKQVLKQLVTRVIRKSKSIFHGMI